MNLAATLHTANGKKTVIELLLKSAPNIVNSFICTASRGYLSHRATERIVPGNWVDAGYAVLGKKERRYLIPNEFKLNLDVELLNSYPGPVCMNGYGEVELTGCEFLLPLRDRSDHKGIYPVFGRVLEGVDEAYGLEKVETVPMTDFPTENVEADRPMGPGITERVELELYGTAYLEPVRVREPELLECRKDEVIERQVLGNTMICPHSQKNILQVPGFYDILCRLSELTAVLVSA